MILNIKQTEQPFSGEYKEKIYDIASPWNTSDWTWIRFEEDFSTWYGEFRGKYRGVVFSEKIGIIVVVTSDYIYVLDIQTKEIIDYKGQPEFIDITSTPFGDILVSDGYGLEKFKGNTISSLEPIILPVNADSLKFIEYRDKILEMKCGELWNWTNHDTLLLDCESMEVIKR